MSHSDLVQSGNFIVGNPSGSFDTLIAAVGTAVQLTGSSQLTAGYAIPLSGQADRPFDGKPTSESRISSLIQT